MLNEAFIAKQQHCQGSLGKAERILHSDHVQGDENFFICLQGAATR